MCKNVLLEELGDICSIEFSEISQEKVVVSNPFRTARYNLATHIFKARYAEGGKREGGVVVVVMGTDKLPHKDHKVQNINIIPEKD